MYIYIYIYIYVCVSMCVYVNIHVYIINTYDINKFLKSVFHITACLMSSRQNI